jgi:rubrerythrin
MHRSLIENVRKDGILHKLARSRRRSPVKRAFASLNAQEALHVAIFIEERNANIYRQFSEMFAEFRDPESLEMASAFWEMSKEERDHGTALQKRYSDRYGTQACAVTEEEISDFIEVPRLENGRMFSVDEVKAGRSPREMALEIAAAAEEGALRFYRGLAETCQDAELRTLYQDFVNFEANHSGWLDQKLAQLRQTAGG